MVTALYCPFKQIIMKEFLTNSETRFKRKNKNKKFLLTFALSLQLILLSFSSLAQTVTFNIDGDPADWFINLRNSSPNIIAKTFQHDLNAAGVDVSIFTGGGSKDDLPMSGWLSGGNSTPPKDDILNAGSMLVINSSTDKKLLFFGDRRSVSGSAQIGLWFFLSPVRINPTTNKFENENGGAAVHTVGDLLVLCEFTNGGVQADVDVYKVVSVSATGVPTFQSFLNTLGTGKTNAVAVTAPNSTELSAADWPFFILNAQGNPVRTDWYYSTDSKGTILTQYPDNAFYEGYVDLAAMEAADPTANFCFTNFLMETRASHEISATLKDMVFGSFEVAPGTPTVDPVSPVCVGGTLNLTATCASGSGQVRWYETEGAGIDDDIISLRGSTSVAVNTATAGTTTYWVACVRADLGCTSDKVKAEGIVNDNPAAPSVTNDDECFGVDIVLGASCSGTGNTLRWFTQPSGGTALTTSDGLSADGTTLTKSGLAVGVHTFYVECYNATTGCVSPRSTVTGTVHDLPEVDGLATTNAAVVAVADQDDTYTLLLTKNNVVNLTATGTTGTTPYSYVWEELDPDNVTTFTYNGTTGAAVFTVTSLVGLGTDYSFRVTLTDAEGCTATDVVTIRPTPGEQTCNITGPGTACENRTGLKYVYSDPNDGLPIPENTDFTYDWTITGNGTITNEVVTGSEISATVTAGEPGSFEVKLTITNKAPGIQPEKFCTKTVTVNPDPTADAGTDPAAQCWISTGNTFSPSGSGTNGTPSWSVDSKTNPDLNVAIQNGGTYSPTVLITHLNGSTSGGTVTLKLTVTSTFDPSCGTDVDYVDLVINAQVAGPSVTYNAPDCDEPTFSLTINSPVQGTSYRVTQPGNAAYDQTQVYSGVGALEFTGLMPGAGYSVSATVGLCTSAPEECASGLNTLLNNENRSTTLARSPDDIKIKLEAANKVNAAPNPFTDRIRFTLESAISGKGTLELYNMLGQKVQTVFEGYVEAGRPFTREYAVPQSQRTSLVYVFSVGGLRTSGKLIGMK